MSRPRKTKDFVAKHIASADQHCAKHGQRLTDTRREVLTLLLQQGSCMKAYELLEALRKTHPQAAPPTIYRPLQFLVELGLVHRIDSLNAYIACTHDDASEQDFLVVCPRCASVSEIEDDKVNKLLAKHLEKSGFVAEHHSVEISAICHNCAVAG
jgi:Fur family zinc uptake transcriptional regulator